ncbi:divalent ion tolerance protein CutA [Sulfuricaulis limicola]|uniref:Divalent ion tolerance protein CutA n=2 Tax=Sulfuricaulis limicola TaxID=1620215 RepID=A0A1B4XCK0_9GAMM|nr:divalent ion tolerance protein CutA [Sulfuricaulis limicola]
MLKGLPGMDTVQTMCFASGGEALAWCRENEPDLCLVDYHMPGMNGIAFITEVRKLPRFGGIPMIMISGAADAELRQRALLSGANDFLTRPVDAEEFKARVYSLLSLRMSLINPPDKIAGSSFGRRSEATPAPGSSVVRGEPRGGGEQRVERLAHDVELLERQALEREHEQIIFKLSRLSSTRDEETGNHMHRVAHISRLIASELGHDEQFCDMIYLAAPMHDIGKVGIPDKILLKPGRLTAEEWEIMKTHTIIGYNVLKDSSSPLLRMGADIAHSHHEKYGGQGYPQGLVGEAIPVVGRIVAVADELDALLSVRPYKHAWNLKDALEQMRRERGRHFDPACIDIMLRHIDAILAIQKKFADASEVILPEAPALQRGVA